MSRYFHYIKNNINYSNAQKEHLNKEELKERKNQIRQQQYEDYSNYLKQKYSKISGNDFFENQFSYNYGYNILTGEIY